MWSLLRAVVSLGVVGLAVACQAHTKGAGGDEDLPGLDGSAAPGEDDPAALTAEALPDRALLAVLVPAIAQAERRVWTAQYTIWEGRAVSDVIAAVEAAATQGLDVRVLADETADSVERTLSRLEAAGAQTTLDAPTVTTHNKLWIVDDSVFTGSHNLSTSALETNSEVSVRLTDPDVVAAAAEVFSALWAHPAEPVDVQSSGNGPVQLVADRGAAPALMSCLDEARDSVRLALYALAYDPAYPGAVVDLLLESVEAAVARGVAVQVVLDDSDWIRENDINTLAAERLRRGGVELRLAPSDEVVHAKVLICDDVAVVSDANWSYSSLELYHGTTATVAEPLAVATLAGWFDRLWARAEG